MAAVEHGRRERAIHVLGRPGSQESVLTRGGLIVSKISGTVFILYGVSTAGTEFKSAAATH